MQALPVVARELRVASRRAGPYAARTAAGLGAAALFVWMFFVDTWNGRGAGLGQAFFLALTSMTVFLAFPAGVLLAGDCLTSEKRDGTLGLLFLTSLRAWDVALGKLSATSLSGAYALLGVAPVLSVSWLLGGVGAGEYLRAVLMLGAAMAAGLAAGLAGSSFGRSHRESGAIGFGLAVAAVCGPFCLQTLLPDLIDKLDAPALSILVKDVTSVWRSPLYALQYLPDSTYGSSPGDFWKGWSALVLEAGLWGGAAIVWLGRTWRQTEGAAPGRSRRPVASEPASRGASPPSDHAAGFRRQVLDNFPTAWPSLRNRWRNGRLAWGPWVVVAGVAGTFSVFGTGWEFLPVALYMAALLTSILWKMLLAAEAGDAFLSSRRSGAFELILATPVTDRDFVRAQLAALARQFMPAGVFLAVCFAPELLRVWAPSAFGVSSVVSSEEDWLALLVAAQAVFLFLDGIALAWLGLWLGLASRGGRAGLSAYIRVVLFHVAFVIGVLPFSKGEGDPSWFVLLYAGSGFALDAFWIFYAVRRLGGGIRPWASIGVRRA